MLSEAEILQFINEDKVSTKKSLAKIGQKYYEAEHDILNYRLFYYNADGKLVEDTTRSNIKISHPFFTELVDQAVQYMLSGKDGFVKTDIPKLQDRLNEYFDDDFQSELNDVLTGTMTKGFDYMYAYTNAEGRIAFQHADGMGVVEVRAKDTDDGCEYVIYWYVDRIAKENKLIKRVEVWDAENVYYYVLKDEKLIEDKCFKPYVGDERNKRPHIIYSKNDGQVYYENFGFIPFFRLDNCKKQWSGLKSIKALIDDYDLMSCGLSNNLQDISEGIYVVSGFQGDNLDELIQNVKTKKHIGVDTGGALDIKTIDIPYQARLTKLELDEKNIYRFGMGLNTAQIGDGNITNVVIKSRYALLDLKCNKLEIRLKQFLKKILKVVLTEINKVDETDYQMKDVWFDFEREVMTNAQDNALIEKTDAETEQIRITTLLNLASTLDSETLSQAICEILDLDFEEVKEKIEAMDEVEQAEQILNQVVPDDEDEPPDEGGDLIE